MTSSVLSTDLDLDYREFIWRWIHRHSDDPERIAVMISGYYDESSVDGGSPISAVGGILMLHRDAIWFEQAWYEVLADFPWLLKSASGKRYVHMKAFGKHQALASIDSDERRRLFCRLVPLINDFKHSSIGASLTPEEYRSSVRGIPKQERLTIHTICFISAAIMQAKILTSVKYEYKVPFMLDNGIPRLEYDALTVAHKFITGQIPNWQPQHDFKAGGLVWEDDKEHPWLQAADIVAWAVRRDRAQKPFENVGFESCRDILTVKHNPARIERDWLLDLSAQGQSKLQP